MRCFVALRPDPAVDDDVDALLARVAPPGRAVARERRHVTLRFLADGDPDRVAARLTAGVAGLRAPALRCRGAGRFGDAVWLGIEERAGTAERTGDHPPSLAALVRAAGADPARFVGHLTVLRDRAGGAVAPGLAHHVGPWWTPREVLVVASGTPYRVLHRVGVGDAE